MPSYVYVAPNDQVGYVDDSRLASTTERHKIDLAVGELGPVVDVLAALERDASLAGVVLEMHVGWPGRARLQLASKILKRRRRVWFYWPREGVVECGDRLRIRSYWRHVLVINAFEKLRGITLGAPQATDDAAIAVSLPELSAPFPDAEPVPFETPIRWPPRCGVYLRTDFWSRLESGGSYGHTCYVARELAATAREFVCFLAQPYPLLDELGVHQVVLEPSSRTSSEEDLVAATAHYYRLLKPALQALKPSYLYERLCLGNYAGAALSRELRIPYIVEYNGSELSMRRSFEDVEMRYARVFEQAEQMAFEQATMISVVSKEVKAGLVARNVDPRKILVNPNGADVDAYAPPTTEERAALRRELKVDDGQVVVGFTGTFGGWHGVDVLQAALPLICNLEPSIRFLLIGDGAHKHLIDEEIARLNLHDRVRSVGRVPQREGARLLRACDICVSPHSTHMKDGRFFGSPTKVFEYMAVGAGIVASDLEQIGEVLSPALRADDLGDPDFSMNGERAVLCAPGDVGEFVAAVVGLARRPDIRQAIGRNARAAAIEHYSWKRHVANLWDFAHGAKREEELVPDLLKPVSSRRSKKLASVTVVTSIDVLEPEAGKLHTGDAYKDEVQQQWDHNPVGFQYVKRATPHTLEWFLEVQAYRYGDYAPWMPAMMEFASHSGEDVLEIGGGVGTDLAQFALNGARVTDLDLSSGHLAHAQENLRLRGLQGRFIHHDAETLCFDEAHFDLVYSNGVLHHTPNTDETISEIYRVLKPGGKAIVMVYAESSIHYWRKLVWELGLEKGLLTQYSMGEIMSREVECTDNAARPLVKVYTKAAIRQMFRHFVDVHVYRRQLIKPELPPRLAWMPLPLAGRALGWNLIVKARKP